ncbi:hypothetical protein BCR34DRAFT_226353 [Clohesyomyces aquaticus]|uniref:Uncharacterized protein n=1 Tax=Clohesyomyces aquaticus TaxID=1231657 RepID=A0A1Y1Y946_9PLEO|nr:hypothetical protein BCR34DRAFT_226353 [Clohesyomyces aquaticus]
MEDERNSDLERAVMTTVVDFFGGCVSPLIDKTKNVPDILESLLGALRPDKSDRRQHRAAFRWIHSPANDMKWNASSLNVRTLIRIRLS